MTDGQAAPPTELRPLSYHRDLVTYLRECEPEVWAWSHSSAVRAQQSDDMRGAMLRQTYRLESEAHPDAYAACRAAMAVLGIDAPVTLYQATDGAMNASLCFIPGEIHLVFYGPILEKLTRAELLALMGHELAHYRLWSEADGEHYTASRILDLALTDAAVPSHRETARLLSLHTELYADRGAALAAGGVPAAISVLVKTRTGLSAVDPMAYLRQAIELESGAEKSAGDSHPENFLRARAVDLWWTGATELDAWIERRLLGPISIHCLDLLRQRALADLTRAFLARFLREMGPLADEVISQVRGIFPDFQPTDPPLAYERIGPDRIDAATRDYFIALMFDCAMVDADSRDRAMLAAARAAHAFGAADSFAAALRRDLQWSRPMIDKLIGKATKASAR